MTEQQLQQFPQSRTEFMDQRIGILLPLLIDITKCLSEKENANSWFPRQGHGKYLSPVPFFFIVAFFL